MPDNNSNDISPVDKVGSSKPIQPNEEQIPDPSRSFQSYMKEEEGQQVPDKASNSSPFDLAASQSGATALTGPITDESIANQMNSTSSVLGDLQNQLNDKKLTLRPSQKYLLRNKLTNANKLIRNAANKTGVDTGSPPTQLSRKNPLNRLLYLVTDSQHQLALAQKNIHDTFAKKGSLSPTDYLRMQMSLAKAQQELEYSSVFLSVTTSSFKTLFNIQI